MRRNNKKGSIKEAKECWKMQKAISEGSHKRIGKANQGKNDEKKKVMEHLACLLGGLFETFFPTSTRERASHHSPNTTTFASFCVQKGCLSNGAYLF